MSTKFIVFEGLDGSGKSFLINKTIESLTSLSYKCMKIHFPSDGYYGQFIKKMLNNEIQIEPLVSISLFAADRKEVLKNLHNIDELDFVFFDRYVFSNIVYMYKYFKHRTSFEDFFNFIRIMEFNLNELLQPDFYFFVDTPPYECYKNVKLRDKQEINEMEYSSFVDYYENYLNLFKIIDFVIIKNYDYENNTYVNYEINVEKIKNIILQ